jgi:hypothetical protein
MMYLFLSSICSLVRTHKTNFLSRGSSQEDTPLERKALFRSFQVQRFSKTINLKKNFQPHFPTARPTRSASWFKDSHKTCCSFHQVYQELSPKAASLTYVMTSCFGAHRINIYLKGSLWRLWWPTTEFPESIDMICTIEWFSVR